jgi:phospholipase/carboxylesterase
VKRTFGELATTVLGGEDGRGGGSGPAVVLLHGFGAGGDDLVPLAREIDAPAGTRFLFPEAPLSLARELGEPMYGDARAWWMIDIERMQRAVARGETRDLTNEEPPGLQPARAKLVAMLDAAIGALAIDPKKLVIGGFSQGSMLTTDLALREERPLAGLVAMSGTVLGEAVWRQRASSRKGLPVFQSHGRGDPLLPFSLAERLRDLLREGGADVQFVPFAGGHTITGEVLEALSDFLKRAL